MVTYLVCVDESDNSKAAFYTTLSMMNADRDKLFILHVVEDVNKWLAFTFGSDPNVVGPLLSAQEELKKNGRKFLQQFARICKKYKIADFHLLLSVGDPKQIVCEVVEHKKVDFLVMGRRGASQIKRLIIGSNSKYCLEHANCNVLIVKGDWAPSEEHSDLKAVIEAEEQERKERLLHENDPSVQEKKQKEKEIGKEASSIAALSEVVSEMHPVFEFPFLGTQ